MLAGNLRLSVFELQLDVSTKSDWVEVCGSDDTGALKERRERRFARICNTTYYQ